jgi:hypothetical protein
MVLVVALCAGAVALRPPPEAAKRDTAHKEEKRDIERKEDPTTVDGKRERPGLPSAPEAKPKAPIASTGVAVAPVTTMPAVEIAPQPRRIFNRCPDRFSSPWVRRGSIQVRVIGVAVRRPLLMDAKGYEFDSPDRALLVWVETRSIGPEAADLRRWIGSLNSAASLSAATGVCAPIRYPGAVVAGQLDRSVKLLPGGPSGVDVLAFEVPGVVATTLTLKLDATHVAEGGEFVIAIPPEAWK